MKSIIIFLCLLFWLLPISVFAHEGHGWVPQSVIHHLTSFEHAVPYALIATLIIYLWANKYAKQNTDA